MAIVLPYEAISMCDMMDFWPATKTIPKGGWLVIFISLPIAFNFLNVRKYGEVEYWLTTIKIITLLSVSLLGILLPLGATLNGPLLATNGNHQPIPCDNGTGACLSHPGFNCNSPCNCSDVDWRETPFREVIVSGPAGRLVSFWECCIEATVGYIGIETLAITAAETEDPRKNMPAAARKVSRRIVLYYVVAAIALSLNVSAEDPIIDAVFQDSTISYGGAFVVMLERWGLPVLGDVVNGVGIIAAFGVANVVLYVAVLDLQYDGLLMSRLGHCTH